MPTGDNPGSELTWLKVMVETSEAPASAGPTELRSFNFIIKTVER